MDTTKDPKKKLALLNVLDAFNGISTLGLYLGYDPDVEYALRINHGGRKFIRNDAKTPYGTSDAAAAAAAATATTPVINTALWPIILEGVYKKSDEIYKEDDVYKRKCATGLFDLMLHYWPSFMDRRKNINNDSNNDNLQMTSATLTPRDVIYRINLISFFSVQYVFPVGLHV
jgi:hypothetical protein